MEAKSSAMVRKRPKKVTFLEYQETHGIDEPTSYKATIMNLIKGNVGTGCFAMADAMNNGGLILGPILTMVIAVFCVHAQHMLIKCAAFVETQNRLESGPDFAETIELSFANSKRSNLRKLAPKLKKICNIFICITQLGFCSVYFLFVKQNIKNVLNFYGIENSFHFVCVLVLIAVWMTAMIRKLRWIAIFSAIANLCIITGTFATVGFVVQNLPHFNEVHKVGSLHSLPIFFGTVLFAFEGIALVLPLQNAMKKPENFSKPFGVLNVGIFLVTAIYIVVGCTGFLQYGKLTEGSLTLNLPVESAFCRAIKLMIAMGVMFSYAIQFFVAIRIMFPSISSSWKFATKHPIYAELIFRTFWVLVTFAVAEIVPHLSLLLSLIGSVCCVVLVFVFPVLAELVIMDSQTYGIHKVVWLKNVIILMIALSAFILGGGLSLIRIYEETTSDPNPDSPEN